MKKFRLYCFLIGLRKKNYLEVSYTEQINLQFFGNLFSRSIGLFFVFIAVSGVLYSQQNSIEFKDYKYLKEDRVVHFLLSGLRDKEHADDIAFALSGDQNIISCKIYKSQDNKDACKMQVKNNITADYIRKILISKKVDFDLSSVVVNTIKNDDVKKKRNDGMPEHYPVYKKTGNSEFDNAEYDREKQEWIKKYPQEVEQITGKKNEGITKTK